MYWEYWGFRFSPTAGRTLGEFYRSISHDEALARIHFMADGGRRLGLLLGTNGIGKSLLVDHAAAELRRRGRPAFVLRLRGADGDSLAWQLASAMGLAIDDTESSFRCWRKIEDQITSFRYQQLGTVVLADDVDQSAPSAREQIVRLAHGESSWNGSLTIVAATLPENVIRLGTPLLDLAELRVDLDPFDLAETAEYLQFLFARAGQSEVIFDSEALVRLYEFSSGVPRRINQLVDLALLAGAGKQLAQIDAETVESSFAELSITPATAMR